MQFAFNILLKMNVTTINIKIICLNENDLAKLLVYDYGKSTKLEFTYKDIMYIEEHEFPFTAFRKIRLAIEKLNIKLLCEGNRIDVHPSGMQLVGFMAYEMELGKPATNAVYIFDETDKVEKIGTVEEQTKYFDDWWDSF